MFEKNNLGFFREKVPLLKKVSIFKFRNLKRFSGF